MSMYVCMYVHITFPNIKYLFGASLIIKISEGLEIFLS